MPLGAARITLLARSAVTAVAQVIRKKKGVVAIGNAQIDNAQSKFGGTSLLTDGTDDCLLAKGFDLTGNWTFEGWYRISSAVTETVLFRLHDSSDTFQANYGILNNNIYTYQGGTTSGTTNLTTGVWRHLAFVRNGNTVYLYVNGTQEASRAFSLNLSNAILRFSGIGSGSYSLNGHSDEIRVSNTARYTSNFTPSTTQFVNDENTLLLLHCDGTDGSTYFEDDNGVRAKIGIERRGAAAISTTQSKFGGSSLGFGDGVEDYYKVYAPTTTYFGGTGDMTFEFWYYRASSGSGLHITDFRGGDTWTIVDFEDGRLGLYQNGYIVATNFGMPTLTWTHVAIVRQGTSLKWYKNGSLTDTNTVNGGSWTNRLDCYIGANYADQTAGNNMNGYIDDLRISNVARYTSNFTAPTAPHVNDANTLLLIHGDGTNASTYISDDNGVGRAAKPLISNSGTAVSTTQSKFGGSSIYFNGSSNTITSVDHGDWTLGTGPYTIEFWMNTADSTSEIINAQDYNTTNGWAVGVRSSQRVLFAAGNGSSISVLVPGTGNFTDNAWAHVAICKSSGSNIAIFVNGNRVYSNGGWNVNISNTTNGLRIGFGYGVSGTFSDTAGNTTWYQGYLNEVRISDVDRYDATQSTYTVPTEPFQNDANTLLLLHGNGTNGSTVFTDDNGVTTTGF